MSSPFGYQGTRFNKPKRTRIDKNKAVATAHSSSESRQRGDRRSGCGEDEDMEFLPSNCRQKKTRPPAGSLVGGSRLACYKSTNARGHHSASVAYGNNNTSE